MNSMSNLQTIFPACHVLFPASAESRRATFYLAAEEYIAQKLPTDNYLFLGNFHQLLLLDVTRLFTKK